MKAILVVVVLALANFCHGSLHVDVEPRMSWKARAFEELCVLSDHTNDLIAQRIVDELTLDYQSKFFVYVNNEHSSFAYYIHEDIDDGSLENVAKNTLCGKDLLAVKIPDDMRCDEAIDEATIQTILKYSVVGANVAKPESLVDAVLATNNLGFSAQIVISSPDDKNAGIHSSSDTDCDFLFHSTPWILGYFGLTDYTVGFKSLSTVTMLEKLQADPKATNLDLAKSVVDALKEDYISTLWVSMVNDASASTAFCYDLAPFWSEQNLTLVSKNLVGKNMLVTGIDSGSFQCTDKINDAFLDKIVEGAISNTTATCQSVLESVVKAEELLEFETLAVVVVKDKKAGFNTYVNLDCEYEYNKGGDWKIFYYGNRV